MHRFKNLVKLEYATYLFNDKPGHPRFLTRDVRLRLWFREPPASSSRKEGVAVKNGSLGQVFLVAAATNQSIILAT